MPVRFDTIAEQKLDRDEAHSSQSLPLNLSLVDDPTLSAIALLWPWLPARTSTPDSKMAPVVFESENVFHVVLSSVFECLSQRDPTRHRRLGNRPFDRNGNLV